jgi:hypothetical protein
MGRLFNPSLSNTPPAIDYERRPTPARPRKTWWQQQRKDPLIIVLVIIAAVVTWWILNAVSAHGQTPVTHPAVCGSEGYSMPEYHVTFLWKQPAGCGVKR